jgi:hypothetical protein
MNLNRRVHRNERWGRVFILLILLMISLVAVDQLVGLQGIFTEPEVTEELTPTITVVPDIFLPTPEEYSFAAPTVMPPTATPTLMPSPTPTPFLEPNLITIQDEAEIDRSVFPGGAMNITALCQAPMKNSQYALYDLTSNRYRAVTEAQPYLTLPGGELLALRDGLTQRNLPADFLDAFELPAQWRQDLQYEVLAISSQRDAVVIYRWRAEGRGIYWLVEGVETPFLLYSIRGSLEEDNFYEQHDKLVLRVVGDDGTSDLAVIDVVTGTISQITEFQPLDAFGGVVSFDGEQLAYWTEEGIWILRLDGTFGALLFPGASQAAWSPTGEAVVMVQDGLLRIGTLDNTNEEEYFIPANITAQQPLWSPGGNHIFYWQRQRNECLLYSWRILQNEAREVLRTQNQLCLTETAPRWSPDGTWLIMSLPVTSRSGDTSGDILCSVNDNTCRFLSMYQGDFPCQDARWTNLIQPYEWTFDNSYEGWWVVQELSLLQVGEGTLQTTTQGELSLLGSPTQLGITASQYTTLEIIMRVSGGENARVLFVTREDPVVSPAKSFTFPIIADNAMHRYVIDLREFSRWQGVVNSLRLRASDEAGVRVEIESVRLLGNEDYLEDKQN